MSVGNQIDRINQAKLDLRTAIQNQGVTVPDDAKIDTYSTYVDGISTVRSVADVLPDDRGNVPLTIDDLNGLSDIKVVSTSTAESGTPASVEVVKSGSVANLSFIIPKGDDGSNGEKGDNGYTPVKGVDYWNESDKQEIVNDVLSNTSHKYITQVIQSNSWQTSDDMVYTFNFSNSAIPPNCKLDISFDTQDLLQLMNDGVSNIRADNDNGTVQIVCIGAKPTTNLNAQISFVKIVQA